jgi:hypothetical protein
LVALFLKPQQGDESGGEMMRRRSRLWDDYGSLTLRFDALYNDSGYEIFFVLGSGNNKTHIGIRKPVKKNNIELT